MTAYGACTLHTLNTVNTKKYITDCIKCLLLSHAMPIMTVKNSSEYDSEANRIFPLGCPLMGA